MLGEARVGFPVSLASLPMALSRGLDIYGAQRALLAASTTLPSISGGSQLRVGGACLPSLLGRAYCPLSKCTKG